MILQGTHRKRTPLIRSQVARNFSSVVPPSNSPGRRIPTKKDPLGCHPCGHPEGLWGGFRQLNKNGLMRQGDRNLCLVRLADFRTSRIEGLENVVVGAPVN